MYGSIAQLPLKTLNENGTAPDTRIEDAASAREIFQKLIMADELRNNTSGNITITCTITTAYIGGTDADKATVTVATRGVANIMFISGTVCVITGNVS